MEGVIQIIKSLSHPRYTGGDFMFFEPVRTPPSAPPPLVANACSGDKFWTTFVISFIFLHDCWSWITYYLTRSWSIFIVTLTFNFEGQLWNLLYHHNRSDYHETKSKHIDWTLDLNCDHPVWPWPSHWPWVFKVKYEIYYISAKNGLIATKRKQTCWLNSRPQMWPTGVTMAMTLTLNFQGQLWNLLYLSQKWSDCHETKIKYIDWTVGLKFDHQFWPWLWPWPWIFKVKYVISYISTKSGPITTKRKPHTSIELKASNMTNAFDLDHDFDHWILKVKCKLDLSPTHGLNHG